MNIINVRARRFLIQASLAFAAVFAVASQSHAQQFSAMGGRAQNHADEGCFTNSNGRVTNACSTSRQWCVAVPQFASGTKTARVDVFRPNGTNISCFGVTTNSAGGVVSTTPSLQPAAVNVDQFIVLGNVSVPGFGAGYVCCNLAQNARINSVNL
jgi:hypothetical protein